MVRPTAVRLGAPDGTDHHLLGRVADVAFRGRGYEHAVELDCGTETSGVFAERRVGRRESVGLRLDTSGCVVFPAGAAATATIGGMHGSGSGSGADAPGASNARGGAVDPEHDLVLEAPEIANEVALWR
ncbi:MAG: TOBE domain-containing protein [Acidimicrobiales bacterium]